MMHHSPTVVNDFVGELGLVSEQCAELRGRRRPPLMSRRIDSKMMSASAG
jgi:hypothetical protein